MCNILKQESLKWKKSIHFKNGLVTFRLIHGLEKEAEFSVEEQNSSNSGLYSTLIEITLTARKPFRSHKPRN